MQQLFATNISKNTEYKINIFLFNYFISVTAALRESLLFDFGASLMSRNSLWLIGIDYLDNSSTEGIGAIEILLSRIPINNEKQALKILNVAKQKGFQDIGRKC